MVAHLIQIMSVIYDGYFSCMIDVIYCWYPSVMNTMDVQYIWKWWMSIIYKYDECPSFMNMVNVHHLRCMHVVYYGCQSYMMDVHHIWGITVINDVCPYVNILHEEFVEPVSIKTSVCAFVNWYSGKILQY